MREKRGFIIKLEVRNEITASDGNGLVRERYSSKLFRVVDEHHFLTVLGNCRYDVSN